MLVCKCKYDAENTNGSVIILHMFSTMDPQTPIPHKGMKPKDRSSVSELGVKLEPTFLIPVKVRGLVGK